MMNYISCITTKINRYVLAFVLILFLPAIHSFGQENLTIQSGPSIKDDTTLLYRNIKLVQNDGAISPDSCIKLLNVAYPLAKKYKLESLLAHIWALRAIAEMRLGNNKNCKLYLDSALQLGERLKDGELICTLNNIAALLYQQSDNYAKAATYYFRALETVQEYKIQNSNVLPDLYNNLGSLMSLLNEDSLGRYYTELALQQLIRIKPLDSAKLTYLYTNLGDFNLKIDSAASIDYYKRAYQMALKYNKNIHFNYWILNHLVRTYIALKEYDSATHYLQLSQEVAVTKLSVLETASMAGFIAYYKKDYRSALKYFNNALVLSKDIDYQTVREIYSGLALTYSATGQYQKAYGYLDQYLDQYEKEMNDPQHTVADFMVSFQALEHEKRITQKQAEIKDKEAAIKKRNFWMLGMCILLALLSTILVMAYRNYRNRKIILNERMKAILQDQEIDRLKAEAHGAEEERTRIAYDLHDGVMVRLANVKMNLNGIPALIPGFAENYRYKEIMGQLDMASRELRNTAHNLMPEILLEDGIAQAIFYFCKATEQASGLKIKFQQVGETLPRLQSEIETAVYRMVQGLIQNVIRHAGATTCLVQLQYADHLCAITVEDNGKGIKDLKKNEGYGLKSIRSRIKILNGTFDIESEEGKGTTAYLEFDVRA